MADYLVTDTELTSIASAIRTKGGTSAQLTFPQGFVDAVGAIPTGGITPTGTKQITLTDNGTTTENVTNYASAQITVAIPVYNGEIVTPAYNVTVSLTNPKNSSSFQSCTIRTILDESDVWGYGEVIGTISSPTGSTEVSVSGVYGIVVQFSGAFVNVDGYTTCTGGVSEIMGSGSGGEYVALAVSGDGTAVIDQVDYDD